jgi:hypothetical protein
MPSLLSVPLSASSIPNRSDGASNDVPADATAMSSSSLNGADHMALEGESEPDHEGDDDDDKTVEILDTDHELAEQAAVVESPSTAAGSTSTSPRQKSTVVSAPSSTRSTRSSTKKRKVTPDEEPTSKKKQQTSVNQMTLANFFGKPSSSTMSTPKAAGRCMTSTPFSPTAASPGSGPFNSAVAVSKKVQPKSRDASEVAEVDTTSNIGTTSSNDPESKSTTDEYKPYNVDINTQESSSTLVVNKTSTAEGNKGLQQGTTSQKRTVNTVQPPRRESKQSSTATAFTDALTETPKTKTPICKDLSATNEVEVTEQTDVQPVKLLTENELSEERRSLNDKYRAMRLRYLERAAGLVDESRDGLVEELYEVPALQAGDEHKSNSREGCIIEEFSTQVVANMVLLVEGR